MNLCMCDDLMNNFHTYIPCTIFIYTQVWAPKNVFFVFFKKIAYSLYYDETLFRPKIKCDNWFKIEVIECKEIRL
jgi:hypothetical protein